MIKYIFSHRSKIYNTRLIHLVRNLNSANRVLDWPLVRSRANAISKENLSPYSLAMLYIKGGAAITASEVNNVLSLTDISLDQNTLDNILSKPRVSFKELNENTVLSAEFLDSVGTVRGEKSIAGVYIWTHKSTGDMYVGSSRSLARRLLGYFRYTHESVGKFIPLLGKESVSAFSLEIIIFSTDEYYKNLELSIEQYFLLHSVFNLNTLKVVNCISGSRSKSLFMYTEDKSQLIFYSDKQEDFIFRLGIHHSIFKRSVSNDAVYLGKYIFTDYLIEGVKSANLTEAEVFMMLEKDRIAEKAASKGGRQVTLIEHSSGTNSGTFASIKDCLAFLKSVDSSANKSTFYKYIGSGKPYKGFIIQWASSDTFHIKDKSMLVSITNIETNKVNEYTSLRQAALSLSTTGQTIKAYAESGKILDGKYRITYK